MDFSGTSTTEAANRLSSFVRRIADETGTIFQPEVGGLPALSHEYSARASGVGDSSFYINLEFADERFVQTQRMTSPLKQHFGGGRITKRGASISLELRLDKDGRFRWHSVPVELTENVRKVIPTDGRPFVLTEDFVADGFRALHEP